MLERIEVKSFQSLHDVVLDLGKFTVILGESESGKSAFVRAVHAWAFNVQGNSHVTYGHEYAAVTTTLTDWAVTIERGEGRSVYRVTDRLTGRELEPFGKLNKGVPDQIREILNLSDTNFSDQFDHPYLLKDSGAQVARVLGELTNVNTILEAVQVGNKKRLALAGELKLRQSDLNQAQKELLEFEDLPDHIAQVTNLETLLAEVETLQVEMKSLTTIIDDLRDAQETLDNSRTYLEVPESSELEHLADRRRILVQLMDHLSEETATLENVREYPIIPDFQELLDLHTRRMMLSELTEVLIESLTDLTQAKMDWNEADSLELYYDQTLHELLVEAGICPTCQQTVAP